MQPLGSSPIIESLNTIGKTLIYVFAALATVGLMFFSLRNHFGSGRKHFRHDQVGETDGLLDE